MLKWKQTFNNLSSKMRSNYANVECVWCEMGNIRIIFIRKLLHYSFNLYTNKGMSIQQQDHKMCMDNGKMCTKMYVA